MIIFETRTAYNNNNNNNNKKKKKKKKKKNKNKNKNNNKNHDNRLYLKRVTHLVTKLIFHDGALMKTKDFRSPI